MFLGGSDDEAAFAPACMCRTGMGKSTSEGTHHELYRTPLDHSGAIERSFLFSFLFLFAPFTMPCCALRRILPEE
jgi:hypothetical protein